MAITLPEGIDAQAPEALELKTIQPNIAARNGISLVTRYEGLRVYVLDTGITYQLKNGITDAHWVSAEINFVSVGTGAEYLTLEEALAAGHRYIALKSDVTIAANIDIGNDSAYILGVGIAPKPNITTTTSSIFTGGNFKFEKIGFITDTIPAFSSSTADILFTDCTYTSNATTPTTTSLKIENSDINITTSDFSESTAAIHNCDITVSVDTTISGDYYKCNFTGSNLTLSSTLPSILTNNNISGTVLIQGTYHKLTGNHIVGLVTLDTGAGYTAILGNTCKAGLTDNSGTTTNEILGNLE